MTENNKLDEADIDFTEEGDIMAKRRGVRRGRPRLRKPKRRR